MELSGKQIGRWEQPFNLKKLAFENIQLGIGISPVTAVSKFNTGGTMEFGKIGTPNVIRATIYVGFSVNPVDSYFYAEVNPFTVQDLTKAFDVESKDIPQPILDTGFPKGVLVSFTPASKSLIPYYALSTSTMLSSNNTSCTE